MLMIKMRNKGCPPPLILQDGVPKEKSERQIQREGKIRWFFSCRPFAVVFRTVLFVRC